MHPYLKPDRIRGTRVPDSLFDFGRHPIPPGTRYPVPGYPVSQAGVERLQITMKLSQVVRGACTHFTTTSTSYHVKCVPCSASFY
eukprot:795274-Rhodomonas_salina.3